MAEFIAFEFPETANLVIATAKQKEIGPSSMRRKHMSEFFSHPTRVFTEAWAVAHGFFGASAPTALPIPFSTSPPSFPVPSLAARFSAESR
ncbi:MAG: hypothetical protein JXJ18_08350 [Rhodobacteraceae bacterium]|nr:hypothetical protein [Paracoccaceae bacterium]